LEQEGHGYQLLRYVATVAAKADDTFDFLSLGFTSLSNVAALGSIASGFLDSSIERLR
jgi:hypothetical protein